VLFMAMLGTGVLQNPMFHDGARGPGVHVPRLQCRPGHRRGPFSARFHACAELALALGWLAVLAVAVGYVLGGRLRSAG
jgi:hypothetical protein